jgi:sulfofructose kinase
VQLASLQETGIDLEDVRVRHGCPNQTAYILIDESTGERTVLWARNECLRLRRDEIRPAAVAESRMLHLDGCDTQAAAQAAGYARELGIPVSLDVDTIYPGFDAVLANTDYLVASSEWPGQWTGESDPLRALELIQSEYGMRVAAMTLGAHGALARADGRYHYSPAYVVNTADTTGAGDVFHGAFCYGVLCSLSLPETLDLSNALAALNCTAVGARGRLATLDEARELAQRAERRSTRDYEPYRTR